MSDKLPKGWIKTTLGEVARPGRFRVLPQEHFDLPYIGLEHIESQTMQRLGQGDARNVRSSSILFEKGDILYGKMRPYLNKVWVAEFPGICSAEFLVFPRSEELNSEFLAFRLNADDFVNFANRQVSGERPRVDFESLNSFPLCLPPLAEQGKIVATLKESLIRIHASVKAAQRAGERLLKYRVSVLHAAVTGKLTHDWRKIHQPKENGEQLLQRILKVRRAHWEEAERKRLCAADKLPENDKWKSRYCEPSASNSKGLPELPKNWIWVSVEQIGKIVTGSTPSKSRPEFYNGNIPFYKPSDLDAGYNVISSKDSLTIDGAKHARIIPKRSVLVTCIGSTIGKTGLARKDGATNQQINAILPIDTKMADFIFFAFNEPRMQDIIRSESSATVFPILNKSKFGRLPIPFPPLDEQAEIVGRVEHRLSAADRLADKLKVQLEQTHALRQSLLREAFAGHLVTQNPKDEPAFVLLERIRAFRETQKEVQKNTKKIFRISQTGNKESDAMNKPTITAEMLRAAWQKIGKKPEAHRLFDAAGFTPEQVVQFYELLRAMPEIREAFEAASKEKSHVQKVVAARPSVELRKPGRFRLVTIWLENFKNLKDYKVQFDASNGLNAIIGWNGTGKSNLFEAIVIIFRDLHYWWEKNRWTDEPMAAYRLVYEIEEHLVEVTWNPSRMKRPEVKRAAIPKEKDTPVEFEPVKREDLSLPRFVFGYYSGPTNRLAEHFLPMKRDHYERLRKANSDDPQTLAKLLEQRRFFCAETHHAKYVLLAFSYKEDANISRFMEHRLRIIGFESALFVIRRPRWAKPSSTPDDFWGATGIMLRVMEKLRRYAIAPMVVEQTVNDGYRSTTEDHYFFFLPDLKSLHTFAAEYADARSFFLALESTDFSELIHDVKIQVRVKAAENNQIPITFRELSEGEQQLLMVLGLMRFTKSHQSLILLDEPDTHLNPHWSVEYLKDLASVISDGNKPSPEQLTSQLLMATHDPLVIASLFKEQVHLLKRDRKTLQCYWEGASEDPRGLGFTGILTSDMFGFRSDLDPETLADLDNRVRLIAKEGKLNTEEKKKLEQIDKRLANAGFSKAFSDPYYAAFVRAWGRKYSGQMAGKQFLTPAEKKEVDRIASDVLAEAVQEVEKEIAG